MPRSRCQQAPSDQQLMATSPHGETRFAEENSREKTTYRLEHHWPPSHYSCAPGEGQAGLPRAGATIRSAGLDTMGNTNRQDRRQPGYRDARLARPGRLLATGAGGSRRDPRGRVGRVLTEAEPTSERHAPRRRGGSRLPLRHQPFGQVDRQHPDCRWPRPDRLRSLRRHPCMRD